MSGLFLGFNVAFHQQRVVSKLVPITINLCSSEESARGLFKPFIAVMGITQALSIGMSTCIGRCCSQVGQIVGQRPLPAHVLVSNDCRGLLA